MRVTVILAAALAALAAAPLADAVAGRDGSALSHRARAKRFRLRIVADLDRRGPAVWENATSSPQGGLTSDGQCTDGSSASRVAVFVPPPGSADMFTDIGFVCRSTKQYWVNRTGGFIATDVWIGPFDLRRRRIARDLDGR